MTRDSTCLFCRIVAGEIPARLVLETPECLAFHDVHPQAPVHVLVIPRQHFPDLDSMVAARPDLAGHLLQTATEVARQLELNGGFRVVINQGPDAGQSVFHLHVHVMGGRSLSWPPG